MCAKTVYTVYIKFFEIINELIFWDLKKKKLPGWSPGFKKERSENVYETGPSILWLPLIIFWVSRTSSFFSRSIYGILIFNIYDIQPASRFDAPRSGLFLVIDSQMEIGCGMKANEAHLNQMMQMAPH